MKLDRSTFVPFVLLGFALTGPVHADCRLKVVILSGQSNMEGKAAASTLDAVIKDKATKERFKHLKTGSDWAVRDDVWVTFLDRAESPVSPHYGPLTVGFGSPKRAWDDQGKRVMVPGVGPEMGIGWVLGEHFDEPVLLIKAAWGGRALKHTFRPPSAMPSEEELMARFAELKKKDPKLTIEAYRTSYGSDYRKIISETKKVLANIKSYVPSYDDTQGYDLVGFVWLQGWNDGVGDGNPAYAEQLAHLIRDLRRDLKTPELPFVIGELGIDGADAEGWISDLRRQQAAVASRTEFKGNVRLAKTAQFWPTPPDLSREWELFRAAAKVNEQKPADDPTRIPPNEFFRLNWVQRYNDQLAYTSDRRYHYLGSGRCYYEMGESMARSLLEMLPK